MNWNQIERKWDEMTRRVQPRSTVVLTTRAKPSSDETDLSASLDPAIYHAGTGSLTAGKTDE